MKINIKKTLAVTLLMITSVFILAAEETEMETNMKENIRIQKVMSKIRNGETVTVVALGGSITTGYNSNPITTNSWAAKTGEYLKKLAADNNAVVNFYNRGLSGTDSAFALARFDEQILSLKPDLVLLEFAMNDQWLAAKVRVRTYETILRRLLENNTAILALYVNERKAPYNSNQKEEQMLCEYYSVPYVSWKDSLFAENPSASFEPYFDGEEGIHPNNAGHAKIAEYMIAKLDGIWKSLPDNPPAADEALPAPKNKNWYENYTYYYMDNIKPVVNTGWKDGSPVHPEWAKLGNVKKGWETSEADAEIAFAFEGKSIGVTYCESDQFCDAVAWVTDEDDLSFPEVTLNCYVDYRKGYYGWAYRELISLKKPGKYVLHIKRKNDASKKGKLCNITGILVSK